jgi:hypothetical protein
MSEVRDEEDCDEKGRPCRGCEVAEIGERGGGQVDVDGSNVALTVKECESLVR